MFHVRDIFGFLQLIFVSQMQGTFHCVTDLDFLFLAVNS